MSAARPRVTLKLATSLDGRIAAAGGASKWITGPEARRQAHVLRSEHDAVLVGAGTVRADDPDLRVRLEDYDGPQPVRVVLDSRADLSPESRLAATAGAVPVVVFAGPDARNEKLEETGVTIENIDIIGGSLDLHAVLSGLAARGVESVMVEGGGQVAASFLRAGFVDRLEWFRAPMVIGGDGIAALAGLGVTAPDGAPRFRRESAAELGVDLWERYVAAPGDGGDV